MADEVARGPIGRLADEMASRDQEIEESYERLSERLSKVALHRYQCARGCQIATVYRADGLLLCAVRGYKVSPGLNETISTADARTRNMVDGKWPAHIYDVRHLHGPAEQSPASITMACNHYLGSVPTQQIIAVVEGVIPGHPNKPTRL
jgi:hypothetical protein